MPSASRPPCTRDSKSGPLDGIMDAWHDIAISPTVSAELTKYPIRMGRKYAPSKPIGNVVAHRNVNPGASLTRKLFQYE